MDEVKVKEKTNGKPKKSKHERIIEELVNSTRSSNFGEVDVIRRGEQIVLPEGMSYEEAHEWLVNIEEAEETEVAIDSKINCYPLDGALALYKALMHIYGHVKLTHTPTMFGPQPPTMVTIPTGVRERVDVPWGRMTLPGIEGYLEVGRTNDSLPAFRISGRVKRKYEGAIRKIIEKTEETVRNESIYRGKAIRVDLSNVGTDRFNPVNDAPKFFDVSNVKEEDLIVNRTTLFNLQVGIWNRLEHSEDLTENGVELKHGALLMGTYGTGKTMTAKVTARKAEQNEWTFLYIESPNKFAEALRLAEIYAPAVVFVEDIDKVMEGEDRDNYMNRILNTMDGVDTKETPVISVLTTNHPEKINRAFLRAGRIDSVIPMTKPDAETAIRFVEYYAADALDPDADLTEAGKLLAGFVPAFIGQAVEKAKQYAISREGRDIKGKVTAEDVTGAAETLKQHQEMVDIETEETEEEKLARAVHMVGKHLGKNSGFSIEEVNEKVDSILEILD